MAYPPNSYFMKTNSDGSCYNVYLNKNSTWISFPFPMGSLFECHQGDIVTIFFWGEELIHCFKTCSKNRFSLIIEFH